MCEVVYKNKIIVLTSGGRDEYLTLSREGLMEDGRLLYVETCETIALNDQYHWPQYSKKGDVRSGGVWYSHIASVDVRLANVEESEVYRKRFPIFFKD